jgi:hypothetical protein
VSTYIIMGVTGCQGWAALAQLSDWARILRQAVRMQEGLPSLQSTFPIKRLELVQWRCLVDWVEFGSIPGGEPLGFKRNFLVYTRPFPLKGLLHLVQ